MSIRALLHPTAWYTQWSVAPRKGGTKLPDPVDPMEEAAAQIRIMEEQARIQEQQRLQAEASAAAERERQQGLFQQNLGSAYTGALNTGQSAIQQRGLPEDRFLPLYEQQLGTVRSSVPQLDPNPGSYFNPTNILDDLVARETELERRGLRGQIDEFAAPGFALDRLPGTFDDPILSTIMGEQYSDASSALERARSRGNLTDFGFDTALSNLETQRSPADARLQGLGGGILEDIRGGLRGVADEARTRASQWEFGDTFNPSSYQGRIDTMFGDRTGRLEGDIRGALGGEQLFDIGDILGRASIAQGAQNQTAGSPALLSALAKREEDRAKQRGIGSQGVF